MANSLLDVIKKLVSGNQTDYDTFHKQVAELWKKLEDPSSLHQSPQRQPMQIPIQTQQTNQASKVVAFDYNSGTTPGVINPLTGEFFIPPTVYPSSSQPKDKTNKVQTTMGQTKAIKTPKKALTTKNLQKTTGINSSIPLLPYTPEGLAQTVVDALKQGKITSAQFQQMLGSMVPYDMSVENIYTTIRQEIEKLPKEFKADLKEYENKMDKVYNELEENLKKQVEIGQKYADKEIELLTKHLQFIEKVFTDLLKEKPNLEPDKWTLFGRQLAMALGSITALAHPGYAPYFYMAIPKVVQYWQNEDMYNFEKAMKRFELALKLAGTQLDFYNQIMEHNLAILEKQKEKELLPITLTGQTLMEKYYTYANIYSKMASEQYKILNDKISNLLALADLKEKSRHYQAMEELQKMANNIRLKHLELTAQYHKASLALRKAYYGLLQSKFALTKDVLEHPEKYTGKLLPTLLGKAGSLKEAAQALVDLFPNISGTANWIRLLEDEEIW